MFTIQPPVIKTTFEKEVEMTVQLVRKGVNPPIAARKAIKENGGNYSAPDLELRVSRICKALAERAAKKRSRTGYLRKGKSRSGRSKRWEAMDAQRYGWMNKD